MSVQVEKLEKNMAKLTIEVPAETFKKAIESVYNKRKNSFNVPGFRKGKVPRKMIEKMYGAGVFYQEAYEMVADAAYETAVIESGLEVVSEPSVVVEQIEEGKPVIFTAEVAVKPEVVLGEYKGLEVEKTRVRVTKDEVLAEIKKEQEKNATQEVVDRAVENGDIAVINYIGYVDGEAFEGGAGEEYPLTIGSGQFIPGFEEQLIGAKAEDEVKVNVTFPAEYHAENLAGKEALFIVNIVEVKTKVLPELDDEFASEVSEFETLDEYKDDVKKQITERKKAEAKRKKEETLVEKAVANATMEIPEAMVVSEARGRLRDMDMRFQQQGLSLEMYMQFTGMTEAKMMEDMSAEAKKNIEARLVLEAIVAAEGIVVDEATVEAELQKIADANNMTIEQVCMYVSGAVIARDLAVQKAVELLVETAVEV
ncbi:MAG: trigger factor [Lachnospiraceae bacterium]|nr:trigger factor [Lachnospiraceae bacterium]